LAERSQKTQYFQSDVRTNRGCSAQLARRIGRIVAGLADRAGKGIVVAIDDFDLGRKRGSVGTASAVFRVRLSSHDVACADRG
jgi:hypothetical protein